MILQYNIIPFTYLSFNVVKYCLLCCRTQLLQKEQLLHQHSSELASQKLYYNQIAKSLRRYEEQVQLNELLKHDLKQAKVIYDVQNVVVCFYNTAFYIPAGRGEYSSRWHGSRRVKAVVCCAGVFIFIFFTKCASHSLLIFSVFARNISRH